MIKNENILCISTADWDNIGWTNKQQIMSRLAKENKVLYVESLGLRTPTIKKKDLSRIVKRLLNWCKGPRMVNQNLFVYSPIILPFHRFSLIRRFNRLLLLITLRLLLKRLRLSQPILWTFSPSVVDLCGKLGEKLLIYHCVDEFTLTPGIPVEAVRKMEQAMLKKADLVFTVAKSLFEEKRLFNPHTYYLPNVADFNHFNKATLSQLPIPADISSLKHPIIGFIGTLTKYKVDFELIRYVAMSHPEWSVVLIGPVAEIDQEGEILGIINQPNIYHLGARPRESLPGYLKGFDVCIHPGSSQYQSHLFGLKFFEYMASGKPIVMTELPNLAEYKDVCQIANTKEEFVLGIEKSLIEEQSLRNKRIELARQNTWEVRIEQMSELIRESKSHLGR